MIAEKRLLVVDDEEVVCQSCSRIFSDRGIKIDTSTNPVKGLELATSNKYSAILLDIKMPDMDGIEFMEELRKKNQDTPVMIITGYSSIPSAAAAMRLGAKDYIPKPFTPGEILKAVERVLAEEPAVKDEEIDIPKIAAPVIKEAERVVISEKTRILEEFAETSDSDFLFYNDSWLQVYNNDSVKVGAFLSCFEGKSFTRLVLPKVGDKVYRGLPIAQLEAPGKAPRIIASPVTGEITVVNSKLANDLITPWDNPCHNAWISIIEPSSLVDDLSVSKTRNVIVLTTLPEDWNRQINTLHHLGCKTHFARTYDDLIEIHKDEGQYLLLLDSASYGISGPKIVRRLNEQKPDIKIIVLRDKDNCREAEYRLNRIFYYAVEPFYDQEIVDILYAAFQSDGKSSKMVTPSALLPKWVSKINITNRQGKKVSLLASGEFLMNNKGLGLKIVETILGSAYPLKIDLCSKVVSKDPVSKEINESDKVLILKAKDIKRIPGTMIYDEEAAQEATATENTGKVLCLSIQPSLSDEGPMVFDDETTRALSEHILRVMVA